MHFDDNGGLGGSDAVPGFEFVASAVVLLCVVDEERRGAVENPTRFPPLLQRQRNALLGPCVAYLRRVSLRGHVQQHAVALLHLVFCHRRVQEQWLVWEDQKQRRRRVNIKPRLRTSLRKWTYKTFADRNRRNETVWQVTTDSRLWRPHMPTASAPSSEWRSFNSDGSHERTETSCVGTGLTGGNVSQHFVFFFYDWVCVQSYFAIIL